MKWKYYKFTTLRKITDSRAWLALSTANKHELHKTSSHMAKHLRSVALRNFKLNEYLYERERRSYKEFVKLGLIGKIKYFLR